jgi:hypothetical protein
VGYNTKRPIKQCNGGDVVLCSNRGQFSDDLRFWRWRSCPSVGETSTFEEARLVSRQLARAWRSPRRLTNVQILTLSASLAPDSCLYERLRIPVLAHNTCHPMSLSNTNPSWIIPEMNAIGKRRGRREEQHDPPYIRRAMYARDGSAGRHCESLRFTFARLQG